LIAIYKMLRNGPYFVDLGPDAVRLSTRRGPKRADQRRRDLIAKRSVRRLEELGFKVCRSKSRLLDRL
jgi:hypothetical protein